MHQFFFRKMQKGLDKELKILYLLAQNKALGEAGKEST
jgi:hypothetical protein